MYKVLRSYSKKAERKHEVSLGAEHAQRQHHEAVTHYTQDGVNQQVVASVPDLPSNSSLQSRK